MGASGSTTNGGIESWPTIVWIMIALGILILIGVIIAIIVVAMKHSKKNKVTHHEITQDASGNVTQVKKVSTQTDGDVALV